MENLINSLSSMITWVQPVAWVLVAVALVTNGILCVVGGDEGRQKAKKALPYVAIGSILLIGATTLAKELVANIVF